ncbi:MAG: serine hydrolase domain-containing protein [Candidatus Acidiferrales bacterium]
MSGQCPRKILVGLVLVLAATGVARADKTDDFIRAQMKQQNIPGLAIAVIKDGKVIKAEGYGLANIKQKIPAKAETVFKIASVSKQFIATGIMLLVQEGKLGLDDPISEYLHGTPATWKEITIRHLLTHTSGIVREAPGYNWRKIQSDAEVIKSAYPLPLRFKPGEKWEYCNVGYFALAEIIRKVSGQPWTDYLNEKVFKPSGMSMTYPTNTKADLPDRAQGYMDNDELREAPEWLALRPSGAFLSTVLDMAKWDAMLYSDKILTESKRHQMWTPVKLNDGSTYPYGFGWYLNSRGGRKIVHHGGGGPGARAWFARFLDDRLTIIVLMNLNDVDPESIVHGVAALYLPAPKPTGTR